MIRDINADDTQPRIPVASSCHGALAHIAFVCLGIDFQAAVTRASTFYFRTISFAALAGYVRAPNNIRNCTEMLERQPKKTK